MENNPPLTLVIQTARAEIIKATGSVMQKYNIPASVMDGILSGVQSDIRAQIPLEIIRDLPQTKDGEKNA